MLRKFALCVTMFLSGATLSYWLSSSPVRAEPAGTVLFRVVDANGEVVNDAVVELTGASAAGQAAPVTGEARMDQVNKSFLPNVLTIPQGKQVSFPNSDQIRHHVYSFSPPKPFEIRLYAGTPGEPVTFDKPGVVVLGCNIHDNMIGYIYVGETTLTASTDAEGLAQLPATGFSQVRLWHAALSLDGQKRLTLPRDGLTVSRLDDGREAYTLTLPVNVPTAAPAAEEKADKRDKFRKFGS